MHGMRRIFPEAWRTFAGFLPQAERGDLLGNYYRRLTAADPAVHHPAARAWDTYESACSTLLPPVEAMPRFETDTVALAID
jgi:proline iminopeptidase